MERVTLPALEFPPAWAAGWGEDEFGMFAELSFRGVPFPFRWIPPGTFLMGSREDEPGRSRDEGPQHDVTLTRGFWLGATVCIQEQWQAVMGENRSFYKDGNRPVETLDWAMAVDFCGKLNEMAGALNVLAADTEFRLPTEAEWEYACRAGTMSAFNDGSACTKPEGKDPAYNLY